MTEAPFDWESFWDIASPAQAAGLLIECYGLAAASAAADCASSALNDDRELDAQYWTAVLGEVHTMTARDWHQ